MTVRAFFVVIGFLASAAAHAAGPEITLYNSNALNPTYQNYFDEYSIAPNCYTGQANSNPGEWDYRLVANRDPGDSSDVYVPIWPTGMQSLSSARCDSGVVTQTSGVWNIEFTIWESTFIHDDFGPLVEERKPTYDCDFGDTDCFVSSADFETAVIDRVEDGFANLNAALTVDLVVDTNRPVYNPTGGIADCANNLDSVNDIFVCNDLPDYLQPVAPPDVPVAYMDYYKDGSGNAACDIILYQRSRPNAGATLADAIEYRLLWIDLDSGGNHDSNQPIYDVLDHEIVHCLMGNPQAPAPATGTFGKPDVTDGGHLHHDLPNMVWPHNYTVASASDASWSGQGLEMHARKSVFSADGPHLPWLQALPGHPQSGLSTGAFTSIEPPPEYRMNVYVARALKHMFGVGSGSGAQVTWVTSGNSDGGFFRPVWNAERMVPCVGRKSGGSPKCGYVRATANPTPQKFSP